MTRVWQMLVDLHNGLLYAFEVLGDAADQLLGAILGLALLLALPALAAAAVIAAVKS